MTAMRYWTQLTCEQFPPSDSCARRVEGDQARFDAPCVSDHFHPWWEPGESGQACVLLGGISCASERTGLGAGVTVPVHRHHPAIVA